MTPPESPLVITLKDVFHLLQKTNDKVDTIESRLDKEHNISQTVKENSEHVRKLQNQMAAIWVVYGISVAALTAGVINLLSKLQ